MRPATQTLSGILLAATSMYLFDSVSGRRRRAQLRDRLGSVARKARLGLDAAGRDLAHRTRGLGARARLAFDHSLAEDDVVAERVRSTLGRVVSHPGAIHVSVALGRVELRGVILTREHPRLISAIAGVRGVEELDDRLEVHEHARRISALQGGRVREPPRFELLRDTWSPAARLLVGAAGLGLVIAGVRSRNVAGALSGTAGGALLLRSTMNIPLRQLASTNGIEIHKTLRINAPVELAFDAVARYENFPWFMRNVRSVRAHPDGRSHWCVAGPAGTIIEWDAETTRYEPNKLIEWRTVSRATVRHSGRIQFHPENGGTGIEITMRYRPPAGALGHGLARLFGVDPRTELDEDLLRLKTFLETGRRPHDNAARVRGAPAASEVLLHAPPEPIRVEQPLH
jgi:uncharacterized membrane protein